MNDNPPPELPDDFEERIRRAYENDKEPRSLASRAVSFLLIAGGAVVAAAVIVPGRTAGASRTARLEWQRRDAEIARVVESPQPPDTNVQP